jgi:hypothetical protein
VTYEQEQQALLEAIAKAAEAIEQTEAQIKSNIEVLQNG